jgi:mono/diheme cytochrome c family protein
VLISWVFRVYVDCNPEDAGSPELGEAATATGIAAHNTTIFPGGDGLPTGIGTGSVAAGQNLYMQHRIQCHGENGRGAVGGELACGQEPLTGDFPDQNIGTYWPFATTLSDFIRRAMPTTAPGSLSNDQVYGPAAYLLYENQIIERHVILDVDSLAALKMPNRDGFIWVDAQPAGSVEEGQYAIV